VALRILRIGRLFQVLNHFKPMRILWVALKASSYELIVLLTVSTVATFFFSTLIYYAEGKRNPRESKFISIPVGLWYGPPHLMHFHYCNVFTSSKVRDES